MAPDSRIEVSLRLRNAARFQKDAEGSARSVDRLGAAGTRAGRGGARGLARFAQSGEQLQRMGRGWSRNVTLPMLALGAAAVKTAVDWESAFAGVRKTVDATEGQYAQLSTGLRNMSLEVSSSAVELAQIAESAGQLGIKRNAILGFTRVIADMGVATNLAGEEGASSLARFANITQMPQGQFDRLGSTIVALGNAGASTEKDIVSMGLRIAGAGSFVGMSEPQILGFANALSSLGIESEAGGTAISKTFKGINSAVSAGGSDLAGFAKVAGMSSGQFALSWRQDAAGATTTFIEGLGRLKKQGKDVPAVLSGLGLSGERVQDTLLRASGAGDDLRKSLGLGSTAWTENNALQTEAEKRYETTAERLKIMRNRLVNVGTTIGTELLPPLNHLLRLVNSTFGPMATAFGKLPQPVKTASVAFVGLLAAVGPVTWALGGTLRGIVAIKGAMVGMRGIFARVFARAGIAGGTAASTSVAATTAAQTPRKLSRKRGVFVAAGAKTGAVMGTAAGSTAAAGTAAGMTRGARAGGVLGRAMAMAGRLSGPIFAAALIESFAPGFWDGVEDTIRNRRDKNGNATGGDKISGSGLPVLGELMKLAGGATGGLVTSRGIGTFAAGGPVLRSLVPPGEDMLAGLRHGEFVMRRKAVETHGVDAMERINRGLSPSPVQVALPGGAGGGPAPVIHNHFHVDGKEVHHSVVGREAAKQGRL